MGVRISGPRRSITGITAVTAARKHTAGCQEANSSSSPSQSANRCARSFGTGVLAFTGLCDGLLRNACWDYYFLFFLWISILCLFSIIIDFLMVLLIYCLSYLCSSCVYIYLQDNTVRLGNLREA